MKLCTIEGCKNKHDARGLCKSHYKKYQRSGQLAQLFPTFDERGLTLSGDNKIERPMGMSEKEFNNLKKNDKDRERTIEQLGGESIKLTRILTDEERHERRTLLKQLRFKNKPLPKNKHVNYHMWRNAKLRANRYSIPFTIKLDDIVIPSHCPVTGVKLERSDNGSPAPHSPSIDRIDPSKGYHLDNIHVISHRANAIKTNFTIEQLERLLENMRHCKTLSPDVSFL